MSVLYFPTVDTLDVKASENFRPGVSGWCIPATPLQRFYAAGVLTAADPDPFLSWAVGNFIDAYAAELAYREFGDVRAECAFIEAFHFGLKAGSQ